MYCQQKTDLIFETVYEIWYYLYNFKNMKKNVGECFLIKLQAFKNNTTP